MANEGNIIIKRGQGSLNPRRFFRPIDKGSSRPAFCYPIRGQRLEEDLKKMDKNIEMGFVDPSRKMIYKQKRDELAKKVGEIKDSGANAKTIIEKDKDAFVQRRADLAGAISAMTPTREDVRKKRINPHTILRREKQGEKGSPPLEALKREYTIISRALQAAGEHEESNHSFLQRD